MNFELNHSISIHDYNGTDPHITWQLSKNMAGMLETM